MRILWSSAAPHMPTGYGQQSAIMAPRLAELGHEVAFAAQAGHYGGDTVWVDPRTGREFVVFPHTYLAKFGEDLILGHYQRWQADLCIRLGCVFPLKYSAWYQMRVASWTPIDTSPVDERTAWNLRQDGSRVVAMSEFGRGQLEAAGFEAAYVPHGIDTSVFRPPEDRDGLRKFMGVDDRFVVGLNAYNANTIRKAWQENLLGFARFHARHPDSVLLVHTMALSPDGVNLPKLAEALGLDRGAVRFADPYTYASGLVSPEGVAGWYGGCDVVLCTSYGEGFGLTAVEAQACGTPVVVSDGHTGPQLVGPGWRVRCEPWWNWEHGAWWERPRPEGVARALEKAYERAGGKRAAAREFALAYDADRVVAEYWKPVLDEFA